MVNQVVVYVLMGTCGCGKTTVAEGLVKQIKCHFIEGDALHPKANVDKMSAGIPLTDDDRWGWLRSIRDAYVNKARELANEDDRAKRLVVVTCSSLRKAYRDLMREVPKDLCKVVFIYLKGSYQLIESRLKARQNHFMATNMLKSQWATLEEPDPQHEEVIIQDIDLDMEDIIDSLLKQINQRLNQ